jgi:hypothetical protein
MDVKLGPTIGKGYTLRLPSTTETERERERERERGRSAVLEKFM